jgi:hypothetical protein
MNSRNVRTAQQVIDQAVSENKTNERLLYGFAVSFVTVGLSVLVWAVLTKTILLAGIGTLTSALFWPAVAFVRQTRKKNILIRLLEAPLSRSDTAKEAKMLQQLFNEIFRGNQKNVMHPHDQIVPLAEEEG